MPIKDILLPLVGDPTPQASAAIEKWIAMAGDIGARVTALVLEVDRLVRPVVLRPEEYAEELAATLDHVAIAWDHTAPAACAVADALPILQAATRVRIFTVDGQETTANLESGAALVSHRAEHGINATFETAEIDGSSIGKVFEAFVTASGIDLLVMGAYRHARRNEFVRGGTSNTVIARPPCWVMMSH